MAKHSRPARMDRQDTPLAKAIRHYRLAVKETSGEAAHYARGALEILLRVKELRDSYREDMRQAWADRASDGSNRYYGLRAAATDLDNIMLDEEKEVV